MKGRFYYRDSSINKDYIEMKNLLSGVAQYNRWIIEAEEEISKLESSAERLRTVFKEKLIKYFPPLDKESYYTVKREDSYFYAEVHGDIKDKIISCYKKNLQNLVNYDGCNYSIKKVNDDWIVINDDFRYTFNYDTMVLDNTKHSIKMINKI